MLNNNQIKFSFRSLPALLAILLLTPFTTLAQKSPIKPPQPLPQDITPKVFLGQCGGFEGLYGPMDYRSAHPDDKRVVEKWHFEMEYAIFLQGKVSGKHRAGTGDIAGGFQYVLRSFPNHPQSLYVMERLGSRLGTERPQNTDYPLECWYLRAFQIVPDDPVVRALYGIYLANRGRKEEALHNLTIADAGLQGNANMQYNIGLTRFKLGKFELAQLNAMRAAKLGFQLDGLEHMLKKAGRWNSQLELLSSENSETPDKPISYGSDEAQGSVAIKEKP